VVPEPRQTVLLVEDEPAIRRLMDRTLSGAGYSVLEARNGQEALGIIEEQADTIDLAVIDMRMPLIGGEELIGRLREQRPTLKVVATSGYPLDAPPDGFVFLAKPFSNEDLLRTVRTVLSGHQ